VRYYTFFNEKHGAHNTTWSWIRESWQHKLEICHNTLVNGPTIASFHEIALEKYISNLASSCREKQLTVADNQVILLTSQI